jgi:hypothetical protein
MLRSLPRLTARLLAFTAVVGCTAPQVQPEWGIIPSPADEVWQTLVEVIREWEFSLDTVDTERYRLRAAKSSTTVIGGVASPYDRFGHAARHQLHDLRVSMRPRGDRSTIVEVVYLIDKIPEEEAGFMILNAVRDRLAGRNR